MALTQTRPSTEQPGSVSGGDPAAPSGFEEVIGSGDHVVLGRVFIGFSFFYLALSALGLLLAGIDGLSDDGIFGLPVALWSSAPVAFVLLGAVPLLLGLAIHVVPSQVGSPSIAFPRAAALSLWGWVVSSGIFLVGVALDGGIGGEDLESSPLGPGRWRLAGTVPDAAALLGVLHRLADLHVELLEVRRIRDA